MGMKFDFCKPFSQMNLPNSYFSLKPIDYILVRAILRVWPLCSNCDVVWAIIYFTRTYHPHWLWSCLGYHFVSDLKFPILTKENSFERICKKKKQCSFLLTISTFRDQTRSDSSSYHTWRHIAIDFGLVERHHYPLIIMMAAVVAVLAACIDIVYKYGKKGIFKHLTVFSIVLVAKLLKIHSHNNRYHLYHTLKRWIFGCRHVRYSFLCPWWNLP